METDIMTLVETIAFALSVLVVTYTVQDGKSNYLEGAMVSTSPSMVTNRNSRTDICAYSFLDCILLSRLLSGPLLVMPWTKCWH
jgi:hypothetical protein